MAQERIEIKFIADGHEPLIKAIQKLDKVTRKLNGQLKSFSKTNVGVAQTQHLVTQRVSSNTAAVAANSTAYTRLQSTIAIYRNKMLLAAFAVGLVSKGLVSFVKVQGIQEDSERRLALAFGDGAEELAKYSQELQRNSVFGDENINVVMAQIGAFGASVEQTKKLTKAVIDLSAGIGVDLNSAGLLVAKTIGSSTDALRRFGVGAQGATEQSEKVANIVSSVDKKFKDWGERLSRTTTGQLDQASNAMGDLGEKMGQVLAPMVLGAANALKVFAETVPLSVLKSLRNVLTFLATVWFLNTTRIIGNTIAFITNTGAAIIHQAALFSLNVTLYGTAAAFRALGAAMTASGVGAIVVGIGIAISALIPIIKDWIGTTGESQESLDKWGREVRSEAEALSVLNKSIGDNIDALEQELNVLNATTDAEIRAAKAGRALHDEELELIDAINARKDALKAIKEEEEAEIKRQKEIQGIIDFTATMEVDAGLLRLQTKLALIDAELRHAQAIVIAADIMNESNEASAAAAERMLVLEDTYAKLSEAVDNYGQSELDAGEIVQDVLSYTLEGYSDFFAGISEMSQQSAQSRIDGITSAENAEVEALKNTRTFHKMSEQRKADEEKKIRDRHEKDKAKARKEANKIMLLDFRFKQALSIKDAVMNTSEAYTNALTKDPTGLLAGFVAALGAAQIAVIASQKPPKMALGGLVGGNLHSQGGTMIEAERGEFVMSRDAVDTIGAENLNRMNRGGGGGANISFSGNIMSDDFIESEAIPKIKEAIRRGADIGIG